MPARRSNGHRAQPAKDLKAHNEASAVSHKGRAFMLMLALQYGLQPLLQKACIDRNAIDRVSLVLVTEVTKIFLCTAAILSYGPKVYRPMVQTWTLRGSLQAAAFPAAAYALQNWLMQLAYANLDSLTFNILNQTKTLFAALSLYLVMGKRQSGLQMLALSLMLAAALLLNAGGGGGGSGSTSTGKSNSTGGAMPGEDPKGEALEESIAAGLAAAFDDEEVSRRFWLGVLPVMGAAFLSGFTGAVTQRTLQRNSRNSFQLSLELAVYGVTTILVTSALFGSADGIWSHGLFHGWTPWTWLPVFSHACGGLIVGQVTKHAGSLQKGFALIAGIFVTAVVQSTLERSALTNAHWMAAALVAGGTYLHTNYPYHPPASPKAKTS